MMLTLKNWCLGETLDGRVYANGTVFGHYRLQDGAFIHTSAIEKVYLCGDGEYVVETHSGSLYQLFGKEMDPVHAEITKERMKTPENLDGAEIQQKLTAANKAFEEKRANREKIIGAPENTAKENMDEDGLYLIMEHMNVVKAILKKGADFRELHASVHVGMFQDSVLIRDLEKREVDFRYFPNYYMEPYHWSDGLNCIYIHNIGSRSIVFKGTSRNIECKGTGVTKIEKADYCGKCVLSDITSEELRETTSDVITQNEIVRLLEDRKE